MSGQLQGTVSEEGVMSDIDVTYGSGRVVLSSIDERGTLDGRISVTYAPKHAVVATVQALRAVGTQEANALVLAIENGCAEMGIEL